jgi:hypothetical protein
VQRRRLATPNVGGSTAETITVHERGLSIVGEQSGALTPPSEPWVT